MDFKHIRNRLKSAELWMHVFGYTAFIMVMLIVFLWGIDLYTHHGEGVEVPDLKGMSFTQASDLADDVDLKALVVDSNYVKGTAPGTILDQTPKPGSIVKSGRTIYLTVNASSSPTRALPDLADNSSVRQAQVKLRAMGFNLGPIEHIDGEKDWVYAIKYNGKKVAAGDRVPSDATLILVVGTGMAGGDDENEQYSIDEVGDYSDVLNEEDLND